VRQVIVRLRFLIWMFCNRHTTLPNYFDGSLEGAVAVSAAKG
jgi:hypothetical protein